MAYEAKLVKELELPISMKCANDTGIEKGALLTLADPMTASAATADGYFAGIAQSEVLSTNSGYVPVYRRGIFRVTCSAAITAGQAVVMTGTGNKVKPATAADVGSKILGIALETTTTDGDELLIELNIGANNNAYA